MENIILCSYDFHNDWFWQTVTITALHSQYYPQKFLIDQYYCVLLVISLRPNCQYLLGAKWQNNP